MMDLSMNFDMEECIVTAMLDQGNRIDTMKAIDRVIPFLAGDCIEEKIIRVFAES